MANYTTNYNLQKPTSDEFYNIGVFNDNADIIDGELKAGADALQTHKTATPIDHPDNSVTDAKIGNRTVDQAISTAYGNTGPLTTILSWFTKVFKEVKGTTNWYDTAAASIATIWGKFHASTGHKHTGGANDAPKIAASSVTVADAGGLLTATDVEGALTELFTFASNGKSAIAAAITGMGQAASGSDTFAQLAAKIGDISDNANAAVGEVLSGKTFYQGGAKKTGTMTDNGNLGIITPGTSPQNIPAGYTSGGIVVGDADLIPENVKNGINIFGVIGNLKELQILTGEVAWQDNPVNVTVTGLPFRPKIFIACANYTGGNSSYTVGGIVADFPIIVMYSGDMMNCLHWIKATGDPSVSANNDTTSIVNDGVQGFNPDYRAGKAPTYKWVAIG